MIGQLKIISGIVPCFRRFLDILQSIIGADAVDGIGDEVEGYLIEEDGGPDGAVGRMGVRRRVEGHLHEFLYLASPCCGEGEVWKGRRELGEGLLMPAAGAFCCSR